MNDEMCMFGIAPSKRKNKTKKTKQNKKRKEEEKKRQSGLVLGKKSFLTNQPNYKFRQASFFFLFLFFCFCLFCFAVLVFFSLYELMRKNWVNTFAD